MGIVENISQLKNRKRGKKKKFELKTQSEGEFSRTLSAFVFGHGLELSYSRSIPKKNNADKKKREQVRFVAEKFGRNSSGDNTAKGKHR